MLSLELQRLCAIELRNDGIIMCLFLRTGYTFCCWERGTGINGGQGEVGGQGGLNSPLPTL